MSSLEEMDDATPPDIANAAKIISENCLVVSSVFMALVLLVYALLPELRNLMGLMLMAYLVATIVFFLLRSIHVLFNENEVLGSTACSVLTLLVYYSMLSSFSWINIISFDIWWTLRRGFPVKKVTRLVSKKFWWYNLYGWGIPLVLTLFLIVLEILDLRRIPSFVKPHVIAGTSCFFGDDEKMRYWSIPFLILVLTSFILFVMTAVKIWLVARNVTINSKSNTIGIKVYVKLSLVMGTTWLFEALCNIVVPNRGSWWWYIQDFYEMFIGFVLFIAFVCKKKVFLLLCKKFSIAAPPAQPTPPTPPATRRIIRN